MTKRQVGCLASVVLLLGALPVIYAIESGSSSSSTFTSSNSTNSRRATYYREYAGQVKWIVVPLQGINENQTYWVIFPVACLSYIVPGQWALVSVDGAQLEPVHYTLRQTDPYPPHAPENARFISMITLWSTSNAERNTRYDAFHSDLL